jgi:hypothetical protein
VALLHVRRDLARWWKARGSYLDADGLRKTQQFSAGANLLLGGRSFQDEFVPRLEDGLTLVSRRSTRAEGAAAPEPELPGFALLLRLRGAEEFRHSLVAAFQSAIGLGNIQRLQQGKGAPFLATTALVAGVEVYSASLRAPAATGGDTPLPLEHNFSPSLAVFGERVVVSSTRELAGEIVAALAPAAEAGADGPGAGDVRAPPARDMTDRFELDRERLAALLDANAGFLIAKSQLDDGLGPEEARVRIEVLREVLALFSGLQVESRAVAGGAALTLRLGLAGDAARAQE